MRKKNRRAVRRSCLWAKQPDRHGGPLVAVKARGDTPSVITDKVFALCGFPQNLDNAGRRKKERPHLGPASEKCGRALLLPGSADAGEPNHRTARSIQIGRSSPVKPRSSTSE
jgi:hypothetical protein